MRTTILAGLLWACGRPDREPDHPDESDPDVDADTDTDSDTDTDTDTGSDTEEPTDGIGWDLPGETPPTTLQAIWIGRFVDEGDFPVGSTFYDGNGTRTSMTVIGPPYVAAVTVIAVDFPDPCKVFLAVEEAQNEASALIDDGDYAGAAEVLQAAESVTPEDYWIISAGTAATDLAQLDVWDLFDLSTGFRTASSIGIGQVSHHRVDLDYAAVFDGGDGFANLDSWVPTGQLQMTALDPVAGTLELTGTLPLRRCPATDSAIPYLRPCEYPNDGFTEGSVEMTLTATRCEDLEDEISIFW